MNFSVSASDLEDDAANLPLDVICAPESGSVFALGDTDVSCSVTDSGGLTTTGDFVVRVQDTTPPDFTQFPDDQTLIASDINGAVLDISTLTIVATDLVTASEDIDIQCAYTDAPTSIDSTVAIGATRTVGCTATDEAGNSTTEYFDVFVTLDLSGIDGFLSPLRMEAPYSAHKLNSTIPHKLRAPKYADGTLATDLALTLVLERLEGGVSVESIESNDYSTGSTAWRYDEEDEHYIFNLKTSKSGPFSQGLWLTTVSYAGIQLAQTELYLRK